MGEQDLINPNNSIFKSLISRNKNKNEQIYSCSYNKKCNSVLLSYKDYHDIVNLGNLENVENLNKISIDCCGLNAVSNTNIFCMDTKLTANKYICFTDNQQKLKICSGNYNNNDQ